MTTAVCIRCGSFKFGAFSSCEHCGALPVTEEDYAVSFVLTDHFSTEDQLREIGEQIAGGIKPRLTAESLPPEMMDMVLKQAREAKACCERMAKFVKDKRERN